MRFHLPACLLALALPTLASHGEPVSISGIYPGLAMFNNEGECGTGAVVPWAGRLWVITYGPHLPRGSSDKLYEITPALEQIIRPESVGGTPAGRLIHRESEQLFIGPYAIGRTGTVRVIPPSAMPGRLTGMARHLADPAGRIYVATMEEGFYEVDVKSLAVRELYADANATKDHGGTLLPGYHGKGLYSGQGVLVYANNGETSAEAQRRPDIESGALAEWDGKDWKVVRRNQFTEVTGPGGLSGNAHPETDPLWSVGWDHRSLLLQLRDGGAWHTYRLPKASHSYDGAHGWNTEWPRIRDVGPEGAPDLLMTMHGMFWRFPRTFSSASAAGLRPRSSYLKVIGDFCRWQDRLVLGCDDTAKSEFLNKRRVKGKLAGPGQSQSNLWFVDPEQPDQLGPTTADGAVWLRDRVQAGAVSDPFLFAGWSLRGAHLLNGGPAELTLSLEVDMAGTGNWSPLRSETVPAQSARWIEFGAGETGEWIRVKAAGDCPTASVHFAYSNPERRGPRADAMFDGLARIGESGGAAGLVRARGDNKRTLALAAMQVEGSTDADIGPYELGADLRLGPGDDAGVQAWMKTNAAIPRQAVTLEPASVLVVDEQGRRWRLPRGAEAYDAPTAAGRLRIAREVATERDLLNCHGTFYELPAENAGGFAKMRPISSHNLRIMDYCSYRGMLIMTGVRAGASGPHIIRSEDGKAALWAGVIDDLWKLGKPVGRGGPWQDTAAKAGVPSDPYLFAGYDVRHLELRHREQKAVSMRVEVDPTGDGLWAEYRTFQVPPGETIRDSFPAAFQARWVRVVADRDAVASATLTYE